MSFDLTMKIVADAAQAKRELQSVEASVVHSGEPSLEAVALELLGPPIDRILCPSHYEKTPSCLIFKYGLAFCLGCGWKGQAVGGKW